MALFKWMAQIAGDSLLESLQAIASELAIEIDREFSTPQQVYGVYWDRRFGSAQEMVKVMATWVDRPRREILIEVRSDEPLLRARSQCELLARQLKDRTLAMAR